ncbi:hypothetical protein GCM10018953_17900 [Streptosporangium nondiastaticum]
MLSHVLDDPSGLSPRAQRFLQEKGRREREPTAEEWRKHWERQGKAGPLVDLMVDYQTRWGGLALPELAAPLYDGGVAVMSADDPGDTEGVGLCFTAARPRSLTTPRSLRGPIVPHGPLRSLAGLAARPRSLTGSASISRAGSASCTRTGYR